MKTLVLKANWKATDLSFRLLQGDKIRLNGFSGAIVRDCGKWYEVRLPGGECVGFEDEITVTELTHPNHFAESGNMVKTAKQMDHIVNVN